MKRAIAVKYAWLGIAAAALLAADNAVASARTRVVIHPRQCTLLDFFDLSCPPPRRWNGASPPVYLNGRFVGQDPDPFIRMMIKHQFEGGTESEQN